LTEAVPQARQARASAGGWQWRRTAETQRSLLDAAREVFAEQGFAATSITNIVERADSSVGSLYHHFGGKNELFLALWQEYSDAQEEASARAVAQAERSGETDPLILFTVGAKAYLDSCWQHRDLAALFRTGDTPPGFSSLMRSGECRWIGQLDSLAGLAGKPAGRLYVTILTSLVREGAHEVAAATTRRQATRTISAVLEYVRRLMADGPSQQPAGPLTTEPATNAVPPAS
jgi:AcrR family transcriptional regulator